MRLIRAQRPAISVIMESEDFDASSGALEKSAARWYRHYPVKIERFPNWYLRALGLRESRSFPDALVPLRGEAASSEQSVTILAGTNLTLYGEVQIPKDARPGTYHSAIVLKDAHGHQARTAVELTVRDVFLAPTDALPVQVGVQLGPIIAAATDLDPRNIPAATADERARQAIVRAFALLHEHGLSPFTHEVRPLVSLGADGGISLDWSAYDAFCGPLIDGSAYNDRRPAHAWPMPIDIHQPDPAQYDGMASPAYHAVLQDYISQVRAHFESKGWLARSYIDFDFPDSLNPNSQDYEQFRKLAAAARGIEQTMPILSHLIPQPMTPFGWFEHRLKIWVITSTSGLLPRNRARGDARIAPREEKKDLVVAGSPAILGITRGRSAYRACPKSGMAGVLAGARVDGPSVHDGLAHDRV